MKTIKVTRYSYIDNNGVLIEFLPIYDSINKLTSDLLYYKVVNGVLVNNKYNIRVIHSLMNNGYKWESKMYVVCIN